MSQQALDTQPPEASPLGMSDEDFANIDPSDFPVDEPVEGDADVDADDGEGDDTDETDDGAAAEADDTDGDESGDDENDDDEPDEEDDTDADGDDPEAEEIDADADDDEEKDKEESDTVDYKAEYEKVMAPFRANGKDMQVKNADEAVQLMQMGANYNKKMAALKPSLKTLKLLENNNLLDEGKLSYLIDLDKKDPEAIKKLIKDSGLDPMEMDVESESDYKPNTYTVDEREMALDEALESIADSPTYSKTIDVVSTKWDSASKQTIANHPQLLNVIDEHMASGIYETISNAVERERSFGRLKGLSDIEAYKQVGDALDAEGKFAGMVQQPPKRTNAGQKVERKPKPKADDPKLKSKKRAASSTKAKPAAATPDYNPLSMSDAEFEKQFNESLL